MLNGINQNKPGKHINFSIDLYEIFPIPWSAAYFRVIKSCWTNHTKCGVSKPTDKNTTKYGLYVKYHDREFLFNMLAKNNENKNTRL